MSSARIDIISIGTLSRNLLWNETERVRTAHATTSLIRVGKRIILVDPGLPPSIIGARLLERTGIHPDRIDTVFLTNFRPSHRAGISIFSRANWLIHEIEQQSATQQISSLLQQAPEEDEDAKRLRNDLELLEKLKPADDKLAPGVDLFPLFGYTPGTCGLLIAAPGSTTMIAGDAIPTLDHFLAGQTLPDAHDIKASHEAMSEVYEIADQIVPGHDNLFLSPRSMGM
jgi:glyoxylase-like metal-dependent hydrolase (beta-lactamase superfamily II)